MHPGCYCTCCVQCCEWQQYGWCSQYTDIVYSAVNGSSMDGVVSILTLCTVL